MDFLSAILVTVQTANWQRGGGKGPQPQPVQRPKERPKITMTSDELAARKKAHADELERRRQKREAVSGG